MKNTEIFIIDDDSICRLLVKMKLNDAFKDIGLKQFSNGTEALSYLANTFNVSKNYIIFLDLNMPIMNGWEFLEQLENQFNQDNFKVYLNSSSIDIRDINRSGDYRTVKKYFSKPIEKEQIDYIKNDFFGTYLGDKKRVI